MVNKSKMYNYNWDDIQLEHNNGLRLYKIMVKYNISSYLIDKACYLGLFVKIKHKLIHSKETKEKLSILRSEFLKNNLTKHPWKNNEKFKSKPCEYFKNLLKNKYIKFIEEYQLLKNRYFCIDIALPDKKIGIEINGNQHYNKDKTLKKYYQDRHNLIENNGWKLYELHFSTVYLDNINIIIDNIINTNIINTFDYITYIKLKKEKYKLCECGKKILFTSIYCCNCLNTNRRKVKEKPLLEQLIKEVEELGYCGTGRKYGVSDNAIRKWIKQYNKQNMG